MVGMRKDLLPFKHKNQPREDPTLPVIKGSAHVERVLIKSKRAQEIFWLQKRQETHCVSSSDYHQRI